MQGTTTNLEIVAHAQLKRRIENEQTKKIEENCAFKNGNDVWIFCFVRILTPNKRMQMRIQQV